MPDRRVTVTLDANIARYKAQLAEAAAATTAFGKSTESSSKEIDKLSGRLRVMTDAALTLGPALIPLGAATIPAITGALAGLGAAAGGIGVTVLAMQGLGDAIKAIDAYKLEPTAANIHKLRLEQEKLGPAGMEFAHYLSSLEPQLRALQDTAREGLFPGLEDGIDALLTRGPQVNRIISELATGMGDIARNAGTALSSDEWTPFFNYIETDAEPTLEAFAQAAGNVALGFANMIVAFAPLSRDFTSSLVDATDAFEKWSEGLADNQSFQDFVDYVRTSGPQAAAFLEAVGKALIGLLQAAAPFGQVVLPVLTALAKAFAAIAESPIGPGLYAAAAGLLAFNRASAIAEKSSARFSTTLAGLSRGQIAAGAAGGLGMLALSLTDVDDKAGLANTSLGATAGLMVGGPWGLAIGTGIGQVLDFKDAYQQTADAINAANDAMRVGDLAAQAEALKSLQDQLDREHPEEGTLANYMDAVVGSFHDFTGQTAKIKGTIADLKGTMAEGGGLADLFAASIGMTADQLLAAAGDADTLSRALGHLNGWFDKRDAVRSYKDSIDALRESLKNGFTREDAANVDAIGRGILQVAQNIKNPSAKADFLANARKQLVDMAESSGPRAAAAIQDVIDKFDSKGLTHPPAAELTVDNSRAEASVEQTKRHVKTTLDFISKQRGTPTIDANDNPFLQNMGQVRSAIHQANALRATPQIDANASAAFGVINAVKHMLSALDGTTATTYVRTFPVGGGRAVGGNADGGTIPGPRAPYGDKMLYMLAPGEEVISNRYGQADRHRATLKAINARRMADGGTSGGGTWHAGDPAGGATSSLKRFKAELDAASKAIDKEKQKRDDLIAAESSFMQAVGGAYAKADLFGGGLSDFDTAVSANINDTEAAKAALAAAAAHGLDGPLYQALAQSGNLSLVQEFAGLSESEIAKREQQFAAQSNAQATLGSSAARAAGFTQAIKDVNREIRESNQERKHLAAVVKSLEQKLPKNVEDGARKGIAERDSRTAHRVRTGA